MEIERKFLVRDNSYKSLAVRKYEIVQGYISKDAERTVRVRIKAEYAIGNGHTARPMVRAYLTIKSKPNAVGFSHFEWERRIAVSDARQLLQMCLPHPIEKTRWIVPCISENGGTSEANLRWEVDEFHGHQSGLVMAELELQSEEQPFHKPAFIGEEVTGNPCYYNANM